MKTLGIAAAVIIVAIILYFVLRKKNIEKKPLDDLRTDSFPEVNDSSGRSGGSSGTYTDAAQTAMDVRPDGMTSPTSTVTDRLSAEPPSITTSVTPNLQVTSMQTERPISTPVSIAVPTEMAPISGVTRGSATMSTAASRMLNRTGKTVQRSTNQQVQR